MVLGLVTTLTLGTCPQASVAKRCTWQGVYPASRRCSGHSAHISTGRGGERPLNVSGPGFCKVWGHLAAQTPVRSLERALSLLFEEGAAVSRYGVGTVGTRRDPLWG